jgi:hypothetical protein
MYFNGHPRIYVSFTFYRQPFDILEGTWTFLFPVYKRWQFITAISFACEEYSNLLFRFYAIKAKISKREGVARL